MISTVAIILCLLIVVHAIQALASAGGGDSSRGAKFDVVIVGGGITGKKVKSTLYSYPLSHDNKQWCSVFIHLQGLASAVALIHREKIEPERICILEQSRKLRPVGATIGLFPNGVCALESMSQELAEEICTTGISFRGIIRHTLEPRNSTETITTRSVRTVETLNSTDANTIGRGTYTVAWYLLQEKLFERIPEKVIRFGRALENIKFHTEDDNKDNNNYPISVMYRDRDTKQQSEVNCKVLIGADGIKSKTRNLLFPNDKHAHNDLHRKLFRAVLPRTSWESLHNLPHSGYTMTYRCENTDRVFAIRQLSESVMGVTTGVTPNKFKSETIEWEDRTPAKESDGIEEDHRTKESLQKYFFDFPDDVQQWIDAVKPRSIYENDVYDLDILEKWCYNSCCVLIGDAAHAMSPSLGQGANIGLEDSTELASFLGPVLREDNPNISLANALDQFWKARFNRVKEVHDVSRKGNNNASKEFREWLFGWKPSFYPEHQKYNAG